MEKGKLADAVYALGNVLLGQNVYCQDVTLTCSNYLNSVADRIHHFMTAVLLNVLASFNRIMQPATLQTLHRKGLRNMSRY